MKRTYKFKLDPVMMANFKAMCKDNNLDYNTVVENNIYMFLLETEEYIKTCAKWNNHFNEDKKEVTVQDGK